MSGAGAAGFYGGERWSVRGPLTIDSVASILAASRAAALPASGVVSLREAGDIDSSAVALLLAWRRRAIREGRSLSFDSVPQGVTALAQLYGVEQLTFSLADDPPARAA